MLPHITTHLPSLVRLVSLASLLGATSALALTRDVLRLLTLHLYVGSRLTRAICSWQLDTLGGLWNLFRGKRWNALRHRTDSYQYDVDQLFLGTLLFTVSAFLAPTVLVYAAFFSVVSTSRLCTNLAGS